MPSVIEPEIDQQSIDSHNAEMYGVDFFDFSFELSKKQISFGF